MANKILIKELSRIAEWFEHQAEVGYHGDMRDYEDAAQTIMRAVELLKEQTEQIERLEHDLAAAENNLNYYVNGND